MMTNNSSFTCLLVCLKLLTAVCECIAIGIIIIEVLYSLVDDGIGSDGMGVVTISQSHHGIGMRLLLSLQ